MRYISQVAAAIGVGYAAAFACTLRRTEGDTRRAILRMQLAHFKLISLALTGGNNHSMKNVEYPQYVEIPLTLQKRVAAWFIDTDRRQPNGVSMKDVNRLLGTNLTTTKLSDEETCTLTEALNEVQKRYRLLGSSVERDTFHRQIETESADAFSRYHSVSQNYSTLPPVVT